jgi:hypothetical protein
MGPFLFILNASAAQETRSGQLAGRSVEMTLVKAGDLSAISWPDEPVGLKPISAPVMPDGNIFDRPATPAGGLVINDVRLVSRSNAYASRRSTLEAMLGSDAPSS